MKNSGRCPKCGSGRIARIPLIKYICCECGYVEEWVESRGDLAKIEDRFGN
ncbi:hypothetical protein [Mediterraneibacter glycyrrhizinilyticus]|uniref:hypothetical protein n=1 Tax=Mediterraneibacter glycyrrhizinilyticus TaxID=342942 RepID=UPI0025A46D02|nr:hypothetical protein [Mediterraneibacter glycyrrhizinilyticus]MDM8209923.1 hypothetical protein [Mediterraneibacter glycyrrhizinilyticus]